jgi:hypothetical protein
MPTIKLRRKMKAMKKAKIKISEKENNKMIKVTMTNKRIL